jgi:chorismate synthase
MTAPLCIAGGIALQILAKKGIKVQAQLVEAGGVQSANVPPEDDPMYQRILAAKADGDSVGGRVRCIVSGMPGGIGGAMYDGLESLLSPIVFGIPGVKGVSFGDGFAVCGMTGSENNDPFYIAPEKAADAAGDAMAVRTVTNHAGGILGGISTGMDIIMDVAFKPTPSIAKEQQTVDLAAGKETTLTVGGRHDPCIAVRAVPVVEAAMALGLLDAMLDPSL